MIASLTIAAVTGIIWVYLLVGRGSFWTTSERDERDDAGVPQVWPAVTAIIPARNEAEHIAETVTSLLAQNYPGPFQIIVVDDESEDDTAARARAAGPSGASAAARVLCGTPRPAGWTGKLWALQQGVEAAADTAPHYILFTDADIAWGSGALRALVARAEGHSLVFASLMVKLRCESVSERLLIPAFVYFFQMLYPFKWVNARHTRTAAGAGGVVLLRRDALLDAGGVTAIRGALIDDCALGALMKARGPVWLGLTRRVRSLRPYPHFNDIRAMVVRSAYTQLHYSPLLLAGTTLAMAITFLAAPLLVLMGGAAAWIGAAVWIAMAVTMAPLHRYYGLNVLYGCLLPFVALAYLAFTIESALAHLRGRGGMWKGRAQAMAAR